MGKYSIETIKTSTMGIIDVEDLKKSFNGVTYDLVLAKAGVVDKNGVEVTRITRQTIKQLVTRLNEKPIELTGVNFNHVLIDDNLPKIDETILLLLKVWVKENDDGSQSLMGRVVPYGRLSHLFTDFVNTTEKGNVSVIPVLCQTNHAVMTSSPTKFVLSAFGVFSIYRFHKKT